KSLTSKALAPNLEVPVLHSQTSVFQQNRREPDLRCACDKNAIEYRNRNFQGDQRGFSASLYQLAVL
ncbi:hypothetical protein Q4577_23600, partial [Marinovum sp. 2_MG-2023]|uniref:hypothetical protein n=1 Tax=unclassified Marinovum TaxID=2647166 RepID=UPI0026E16A2E